MPPRRLRRAPVDHGRIAARVASAHEHHVSTLQRPHSATGELWTIKKTAPGTGRMCAHPVIRAVVITTLPGAGYTADVKNQSGLRRGRVRPERSYATPRRR